MYIDIVPGQGPSRKEHKSIQACSDYNDLYRILLIDSICTINQQHNY